jgi:uncharacterized membrane protein
MTNPVRIIIHALTGVVLGVIAAVCAIVLTLMLVFFTGEAAELPGVIRVWPTEENDAIALNFAPNGIGLALLALVVAGIYVGVAYVVSRRRPAAAS